MGVGQFDLYDEDGVDDVNIPNQFFKKDDVGKFKAEALQDLVREFSGSRSCARLKFFEKGDKLAHAVVVATDSMASRKLVWSEFLKQDQCSVLIEARMGAELGQVYTIVKSAQGKVSPADQKFYADMLYSDESVAPLKCTARTIIYNVLMLSSLICRCFKGYIQGEKLPRELTFSMVELVPTSWMVRE